MKISDGFDARRLRPRPRRTWRARLGAALGLLLCLGGLLSILLGALSLAEIPGLEGLAPSPEGAATALVAGLVALLPGIWLWQRCRRGLRPPEELSLSPHLFRKRR